MAKLNDDHILRIRELKTADWKKATESVILSDLEQLIDLGARLTGKQSSELRRRIRSIRIGNSQEAIALTWAPDADGRYEIILNAGILALVQHMIKLFAAGVDDRFWSLGPEQTVGVGAHTWSPRVTKLARELCKSYWTGSLVTAKGLSLADLEQEQVAFALQVLGRIYRYLLAHEFAHILSIDAPNLLDVPSRVNNITQHLLEAGILIRVREAWLPELRADLLARDLLLLIPISDGLQPQFSAVGDVARTIDCFTAELTWSFWVLLEDYYEYMNGRTYVSNHHPDSRIRISALRASPTEAHIVDRAGHVAVLHTLRTQMDRLVQTIRQEMSSSLEHGAVAGSVALPHVEEAIGKLPDIAAEMKARQADVSPFDELIEYRQSVKREPNNADCWNRLGHASYEQGLSESALEAYRKVLELGKDSSDAEIQAIAYANLGTTYLALGDLQQAFSHLLLAAAMHNDTNNDIGLATIYAGLVKVCEQLGDKEAAQDYTVLMGRILLRLKGEMAFTIMGPLDIGCHAQQLPSRTYLWKKALASSSMIDRAQGAEGAAVAEMLKRGEIVRAAELFERSCRPNEWVFLEGSRFAEGLEWVFQFVAEVSGRERLQAANKLTEYFNVAGLVLLEIGHPQLAASFFQATINDYKARGDKLNMVAGLYNFLVALLDLGQLSSAISVAEDMFEYVTDVGLPVHFCSAWSIFGSLLGLVGQTERAREAFDKAAFYERDNPLSLGRFGNNTPYWADFVLRQKGWQDARREALEYLAVCVPRRWLDQEIRCRKIVGEAETELGNYKEATFQLTKAESTARSGGYLRYLPGILNAKATLHSYRGEASHARTCVDEAIRLAKERHRELEAGESYFVKSRLLLRLVPDFQRGSEAACNEILEAANEALGLAERTGSLWLKQQCFAVFYEFFSKSGDLTQARRFCGTLPKRK